MSVVSDEIALLILAAGQGSRMGGGKLLLDWRGMPLVCHVVAAARAMRRRHPVVMATGSDAAAVRDAVTRRFDDDAPAFVQNNAWHDGQSTSLRAGLEAVMQNTDAAALKGIMVLLGDQPLVAASTLDALADSHLRHADDDPPCLATAPVFTEKRGNPVVLSPALFPEVLALQGDTGARKILASLGGRLNLVLVDDPGVVRDIDSPDDYDALRRDHNAW